MPASSASPPAASKSLLPTRMIARMAPRRSASTIGSKPGSSRRADQSLDAGNGQLLELGIRQIDDLRHEVAREHLVEVFFGELRRNGVVRQVRFGTRRGRTNLERRIQFHARTARNVGQLHAIDRGRSESCSVPARSAARESNEPMPPTSQVTAMPSGLEKATCEVIMPPPCITGHHAARPHTAGTHASRTAAGPQGPPGPMGPPPGPHGPGGPLNEAGAMMPGPGPPTPGPGSISISAGGRLLRWVSLRQRRYQRGVVVQNSIRRMQLASAGQEESFPAGLRQCVVSSFPPKNATWC